MSEIFDRVRLTVAPPTYGAAVKRNVIDNLAAGVLCIYTSIAGEGMGLPGTLDKCRGDDAGTISEAVIQLHRDAGLNHRCSQAGLEYVREELSEEKLNHAMQDVIAPRCRGSLMPPLSSRT